MVETEKAWEEHKKGCTFCDVGLDALEKHSFDAGFEAGVKHR